MPISYSAKSPREEDWSAKRISPHMLVGGVGAWTQYLLQELTPVM